MKHKLLLEPLIAILIVISTGINGFISFVFLSLFSNLKSGKDSYEKHGLAKGTSRLGGVAIILTLSIGIAINLFIDGQLSWQKYYLELNALIVFSFFISLIGLFEDFKQEIPSIYRLVATITAVGFSLSYMIDLLPVNLPLFLSYGITSSAIILLFTTLMIVGFVNAGNMVDGANGLLSIISLSFFLMLYSQYESYSYLALIIGLISFSLYNTLTGKIFLGDCGSYFLSSFIAFSSLKAYQELNFPIFLFASFLIYPCYEIIRTILTRFISSAPIMSPDNKHLHNYVNEFYLSCGFKINLSNSLTGISIAVITSIPSLYSFFILGNLDSNFWLKLFITEFICLAITYHYFSKINGNKSLTI